MDPDLEWIQFLVQRLQATTEELGLATKEYVIQIRTELQELEARIRALEDRG